MTPSSAPPAAEAAAGIAGPHTREWTPRRRPSRTPTTRLAADWRWPARVYIVQGHVFGNKRTGAAAMLTFIRANGGRTAISDERPLVTLGGSLPRSDHLEPQSPRRPGLSDIVGHQAGDVEFRHGGQVEPVQRASENPAGAEMLSQGRLEHAAGVRAKSKRIGGPELCELARKRSHRAFPYRPASQAAVSWTWVSSSASEETMTRSSLATWSRTASLSGSCQRSLSSALLSM